MNLRGVWQAAYTAGRHLPVPVATCQYWHRSLDPKKLIAVGFSRLQPRMTLARTLKLYKIPDVPQIPGIRLMQPGDSQQVGHASRAYRSRSFEACLGQRLCRTATSISCVSSPSAQRLVPYPET